MLDPEALQALDILLRSLTAPGATDALLAHWRLGRSENLSPEVRAAADTLDAALAPATLDAERVTDLAQRFSTPAGVILLAWGAANAARADLSLAPLLSAAVAQGAHPNFVPTVARARVLEGPLSDALECVPLAGDGAWLDDKSFAQARARVDILLWEAGTRALRLPTFGAWLWRSESAFESLIERPSHGTLRGRVLAARCTELSASALSAADRETTSRALKALQPLLLHPEPMVWIHAARAVGLFAGVLDALEGTLLDWMRSESPLLRQRAITAFASQSPSRLSIVNGELSAIIDSPHRDGVLLGAIAAATPYLVQDRLELWQRLTARILDGDGGATAARALARGALPVWRDRTQRQLVEPTLRRLRVIAQRARSSHVDEWKRWLDVLSLTDVLDGAERDPLDLELGLENLTRLAAQHDDEEADARAARFALTLGTAFDEALRAVVTEVTPRRRAAAINVSEGLARALALALWVPLLATAPNTDPVPSPDTDDTRERFVRAPESLLDDIAEHRTKSDLGEDVLAAIEVLAIRLGSYALDAYAHDDVRKGAVAHQACGWLRKVNGLTTGTRTVSPGLQSALAGLLWRLVDTTRGTSLGELEDLQWLGPFAAWWALVIDRPAVLRALAAALPMADPVAIERACTLADALRTAVVTEVPVRWNDVHEALTRLHARDTELAQALFSFGDALTRFEPAAGTRRDLDSLCLDLVVSAERLSAALGNPIKALHPKTPGVSAPNAPRTSAQVSRAIKHRDLGPLAVWFEALGTLTSTLVRASLSAAVKRTPPPPPTARRTPPTTLAGYELVRSLGEGGVGKVWLVRRPGADRLFVLKIPKADVLADADERERTAILSSFVDEARALAGLYHPNVASIVDRGVSDGVPYLVLEYLVGADLKVYSRPQRMSVFELRSVVSDVCAGLTALHTAGLVHRDIKPANLWLRLPLAHGEVFDPERHRDPARTRPLSTVLIDFGMVRAARATPETVGRFVAGTPGYIAPEQVLDPLDLDPRADVYGLAGTIYNVFTHRAFFDDLSDTQARVIAHMKHPPLAEPERVKDLPGELARLLRAATELDPTERPTPAEFARAFALAFG